jgi:hypothetical protein
VRSASLRRTRTWLGGLSAAAILFGAADALADGRAELEKARASFLARNFSDAEERLRSIVDPRSGIRERSLISQARMYLGAIYVQQGRTDEAKELFRTLVFDDSSFEPDPLSFPSERR